MKKYIILLGLLLSIAACELWQEEDVIQDEIIKLTIEADEPLIADASEITLKVKIPSKAADDSRKITFEKSGGSFLSTDGDNPVVDVNEEGLATIGLQLPQDSGSLYLKATAGTDFEAETTLVLGASYPDELLIEPQATTISKTQNSAIVIRTKMIKATGKPSTGIPVSFTATQSDSLTIGRFVGLFDARSDAEGIVTATLQTIAGDVQSDDPVIIEACARNDNRDSVCVTFQLRVVE
ncbi:MAG: hypothetical protein AAFQ83_23695 [Bacteroidota bacterium]